MSAPQDQRYSNTAWSTAEQYHLIFEIIKERYPSPNALFDEVIRSRIQPNWEHTPLPPGRSLSSCRLAFEELRRASVPAGSYGTSTPSPMSAPPAGPRSRPFAMEGLLTAGREIRPKPAPTEGGYGAASTVQQPNPMKKRGRPPKVRSQPAGDVQKAEASPATSVETIALTSVPLGIPQSAMGASPIVRSPAALPSAAMQPPSGLARSNLAPSTRVPVSSLVSSFLTPTEEPDVGQDPNSSGKRKRTRSMRSDSDHDDIEEGQASRRLQDYGSPYGRLSVLRREERESGTRSYRSTEDEGVESQYGPTAPSRPRSGETSR